MGSARTFSQYSVLSKQGPTRCMIMKNKQSTEVLACIPKGDPPRVRACIVKRFGTVEQFRQSIPGTGTGRSIDCEFSAFRTRAHIIVRPVRPNARSSHAASPCCLDLWNDSDIYIHDLRLTRCLARFQTGAAWIRPVKVTIEDNEYAALVAKAKPLLRSKPPVNVHDLPEKTNVAQTISKPTVLPNMPARLWSPPSLQPFVPMSQAAASAAHAAHVTSCCT